MKLAKRLGQFQLGVVILLTLTQFIFAFERNLFRFDTYSFAANALTLWNFSSDPFGFDLIRPLLPTLLIVPLAGVFYKVENPLIYLKSIAILFTFCSPILLLIINNILKQQFVLKKDRYCIIFLIACSILLITTTVDWISDVLGGIFVMAAFGSYVRWRQEYPRRALILACLFSILAAATRHNYLIFGLVFLFEEFWRVIIQKRLVFKKTIVVCFIVAALLSLLSYFAPYIYQYGFLAPLEVLRVFGVGQELRHKLSQGGFVYHKLIEFALPLPVLLFAFLGFLRISKNFLTSFHSRFLCFYTCFFLITHLTLIPHQYVRFLIPFLLPLSLGLGEGFKFLRKTSVKNVIVLLLIIFSLIPLKKTFQWYLDPIFFSKKDLEMSQQLSYGKRILWCAKSFPFVPLKNDNFSPNPSFALYHYANHTFKVHTGRDTLYIPTQEFMQQNKMSFPVSLLGKLKDQDTVFYNPNGTIFYHGGAHTALPVSVISYRKVNLDNFSLKGNFWEPFLKYQAPFIWQAQDQSKGWLFDCVHPEKGWSQVHYSSDYKVGKLIKSDQEPSDTSFQLIYIAEKIDFTN